ncbi:hypothetical protein D3C72_344990 [compost metagenome]
MREICGEKRGETALGIITMREFALMVRFKVRIYVQFGVQYVCWIKVRYQHMKRVVDSTGLVKAV